MNKRMFTFDMGPNKDIVCYFIGPIESLLAIFDMMEKEGIL